VLGRPVADVPDPYAPDGPVGYLERRAGPIEGCFLVERRQRDQERSCVRVRPTRSAGSRSGSARQPPMAPPPATPPPSPSPSSAVSSVQARPWPTTSTTTTPPPPTPPELPPTRSAAGCGGYPSRCST